MFHKQSMKKSGKNISLILVFAMAVSLCLPLAGCTKGSSDSDGSSLSVYYCNADSSNIISKSYSGISDSQTAEEKVDLLLEQLFNNADEANGYYSVSFNIVEITEYEIDEEGILTIDFSSGYSDLTDVQKILLRAAVVLTLLQVDAITGVALTVENVPVTDSDGEEIGTMTADTFAGILITEEGMLEMQSDLKIFFADRQGQDATALAATTVTFYSASNTTISQEEYILQCLIEGPAEDSGLYPTVESSVVVLSVSTTDGVCYVNFSSSFSEQTQDVSDELMIYSIVNSLCCLTYVSSVQFLIEGELEASFHEVVDLSQPLSRRRDLEVSQ